MKGTILIVSALLAITAPASAAGTGPAGLLPAEDEMHGWKKDGEVLTYEPEALWEYIDGQAETFLMYDFLGVAAQHYLDADGLEIKVEIYEHGNPLQAYGIYTQFRSPESGYIEGLGNEAFGDEYSIHFWKGRYYVKIYAYDEGEKSAEAMMDFARAVADKIQGQGGEPAEASLFPGEGLVVKSVTYVTMGVMGSEKFPPAFTGEYRFGEEKGKLYLFPLESGKAAADLFEWYRSEIGSGNESPLAGDDGVESFIGEAPYRGLVLVFRTGDFMGIMTGLPVDSKEAVSTVREAVKNIRAASGG